MIPKGRRYVYAYTNITCVTDILNKLMPIEMIIRNELQQSNKTIVNNEFLSVERLSKLNFLCIS